MSDSSLRRARLYWHETGTYVDCMRITLHDHAGWTLVACDHPVELLEGWGPLIEKFTGSLYSYDIAKVRIE